MNLTKLYLEKKFEEYYSKNDLTLPTRYKNREFAFVPLELLPDFVMHRHISFKSQEDFKAYVLSKIPAHIYFSSAYYEKPDEAKMEAKGWLGADLMFDIDADHLPVKTSSLDKALELSKREAKKLVAVLRSDFGIGDMDIYFSGGRGYHVHVHDDEFLSLGSGERREIIDYLTLNSPKIVDDRRLLESNAARRVVNYMKRKLKIKPKEFKKEKLTKKAVESIERFREEAERVLKIYIDAPVTADVKRLIRLPGSLHGKTGLKVTKVWDIDEFNPLMDAVAFGDEEVVLRVNKRINLKIGDMNARIYPGRIRLPEYAAIFLICRGLAVYEGTA